MEKFGIENLKKLLAFGCAFAAQIASSLADGFQWTDAFGFVDEAALIPGVVKSIPAVKQELADLSAEERNELNAFLQEKFDIPNDKLESVIEHAIGVGLNILALVEEFKAMKKA